MAAGYCAQELERVAANHLLPPEIIAEIGIVVDTTVNSAAACRSHAVIEGLAAHLASILGLAGMGTQHRPPPANATPHNQHADLKTNGGMMAHVAPGSGKNDDMVLCPGTVKMFATTPVVAAPPASSADLLPERRHQNGRGTGVFMPLAGAYRARPFKSRSSKGVKPPRLMRKEAAECRCSRVASLH
ncbi:hypothetical protein PAHAL_3G080800 [Panicum hallii]|uniref:Uncharacterized protein n=1 Tax=Panicum hallii TaxID=206008 RepID=A0A2T8KHH2_9POAL|nr:hypothetical protein PAHAL_3G080800 [Panicum hallii]